MNRGTPRFAVRWGAGSEAGMSGSLPFSSLLAAFVAVVAVGLVAPSIGTSAVPRAVEKTPVATIHVSRAAAARTGRRPR
jgi:hypothetical protein